MMIHHKPILKNYTVYLDWRPCRYILQVFEIVVFLLKLAKADPDLRSGLLIQKTVSLLFGGFRNYIKNHLGPRYIVCVVEPFKTRPVAKFHSFEPSQHWVWV